MTHAGRIALVITCLAALATSTRPAAGRAAYRLDAGDVLEIAVFGVADFRRRVTVNVDGHVSVPFLGEVPAAGATLPDLRRTLAQALSDTGRIRAPDVTVELVEHRPFYISGDVSRPGAHPYRPGLTARQAVALAGGYDALRFRTENPLMTGADLQSQNDGLWLDLLRQTARAASLAAEMDETAALSLGHLHDAPVPRRIVEEITALEGRDLTARLEVHRKERDHLVRGHQLAGAAIATLEDALRQLRLSLDLQERASDRAAANAARGVASAQRVEEERRALAALRSQQVDTASRLAQASRDRDNFAHQMEQLADGRRARLIQAQRDAAIEIEKLRSQLRASGEKLLYTGALKAQLRRGAIGPEIVIHRRGEDGPQRIPVTEDAELAPGDVVDVVIRPDQAVVDPGRPTGPASRLAVGNP